MGRISDRARACVAAHRGRAEREWRRRQGQDGDRLIASIAMGVIIGGIGLFCLMALDAAHSHGLGG